VRRSRNYARAEERHRGGRFAEALELDHSALAFAPNSAELHLAVGVLTNQTGRQSESLTYFEEATFTLGDTGATY
jgi:Flp pilus assembly protein TadD